MRGATASGVHEIVIDEVFAMTDARLAAARRDLEDLLARLPDRPSIAGDHADAVAGLVIVHESVRCCADEARLAGGRL